MGEGVVKTLQKVSQEWVKNFQCCGDLVLAGVQSFFGGELNLTLRDNHISQF